MKLTSTLLIPLATLAACQNWYGVRDVAYIAADRINGGVMDAVNNLRNEILGTPNTAAGVRCRQLLNELSVDIGRAADRLVQIGQTAQGVIDSSRLAAPEGSTNSLAPLCPA
ncbi:hypothetical protein B0T16DRAFT_388470 [Cercophora newfieldiana]|uniref:Lipoprotein n=1 Tax=Cercophora newfieldiana TaxID=92897 RepID=A0AA40CR69_9PEZI|nr:hypothetical protein B0T16DRAFT_388470 [Cercophora newfieldiana]